MARDSLFDIEWEGLDELAEEFDKMEKHFEDILLDEYTKYGKLVEEAAKELAPVDDSELIEGITFDKAKTDRHGAYVEGGGSAKHSLRRHEEPYRKGTFPKYDNGAKFDDYYINGRGLGTRKKPNYRGFQPGRKFLENAIKATEEDYDEMNQRILNRTLGERK